MAAAQRRICSQQQFFIQIYKPKLFPSVKGDQSTEKKKYCYTSSNPESLGEIKRKADIKKNKWVRSLLEIAQQLRTKYELNI